MATMYYSFTVSATGTSTPAYYAINFDPGITTMQSAFQFLPSGTQNTYVAVSPEQVGMNLPPVIGLSGGVTITATVSRITGQVMVSPPVNVPVTFQLWGLSLIGSVTIPAGQTSALFNFDISDADGFADTDAARKSIESFAPKPE